jgi:formylglycine-generating enzyme required for sulfatase activity
LNRAPELFIRSLVLLCVAFPALATPDWNTLNRSIVKVEAAKKPASDIGAGIVIMASSDSIRILTAAHVVADATAWKVYFYSDQVVGYTATVLPRSSDGLDLAVLEVRPQGRALPGNLPQLPIRDRDTLRVDERIWTVDSEWVHIPNTVVRLDHDSDTRLFEYTKAAVDEGFSGGPVFDDDGRLAGIHRGGGAGGRYAVAAKLDSAVDALAALGHNTPNLVRGGTVASTIAVPVPPPPFPSAPQAGDTRVNAKDGLTYVWIPAGSFTMGCSPGDTECESDEKPAHAEQIANGFWLGQTEVTQAAWTRVMTINPSSFKGDQLPVENADWSEAAYYCKAIGERLPTEEEWEYAARAGTTRARYGALDAIAWYGDNSRGSTHPVGLKQANAYGLYDMLGNVWEWTADDHGDGAKVVRGGAWSNGAGGVRASYRFWHLPTTRDRFIGFRCAGEFR